MNSFWDLFHQINLPRDHPTNWNSYFRESVLIKLSDRLDFNTPYNLIIHKIGNQRNNFHLLNRLLDFFLFNKFFNFLDDCHWPFNYIFDVDRFLYDMLNRLDDDSFNWDCNNIVDWSTNKAGFVDKSLDLLFGYYLLFSGDKILNFLSNLMRSIMS